MLTKVDIKFFKNSSLPSARVRRSSNYLFRRYQISKRFYGVGFPDILSVLLSFIYLFKLYCTFFSSTFVILNNDSYTLYVLNIQTITFAERAKIPKWQPMFYPNYLRERFVNFLNFKFTFQKIKIFNRTNWFQVDKIVESYKTIYQNVTEIVSARVLEHRSSTSKVIISQWRQRNLETHSNLILERSILTDEYYKSAIDINSNVSRW